ncbi:MAG: DUF4338 domain-containing protein [Gammaproteobacteria bacterium]
MTRYCGRNFNTEDIEKIRTLIREDPSRTRADLSRLTCQRLDWRKPNGGLKDMACRVAMLRMHKDGLIELPPPRGLKPHCKIALTAHTEAQPPLTQPVHTLPKPQLQLVSRTDSRLWNEYIERYHYLGYTPLPGAQLRYFITAGDRLLALLGFGAAAWQLAPRDTLIGCNDTQRQEKLHLVVNNARFLILPWVQSKGLASKVLAITARQLPEDWFIHYGYRPVLMETFVDQARFRGTCYKAANWVHVGQTQGRGKLGPSGKHSVPIKDIWLYPLTRHFQRILTAL